MNRRRKSILGLLLVSLGASTVLAQTKQVRHERHPAVAAEEGASTPQTQPTYQYFSILDGTPMGLWLHHDTEVGTGKPVDVYQYAIELQVLN